MPLDGTNYEQQDAVLDLLRQARERIARPGGWCQDALHNEKGAVCIIGAIHYSHPGNDWESIVIRRDAYLRVCDGLLYQNGIYYNDYPGRTQAEIVALFDAAIAARESA